MEFNVILLMDTKIFIYFIIQLFFFNIYGHLQSNCSLKALYVCLHFKIANAEQSKSSITLFFTITKSFLSSLLWKLFSYFRLTS